jgi:hypothetical protein
VSRPPQNLDEIVVVLEPRFTHAERQGVAVYDACVYAPPHVAVPASGSPPRRKRPLADMPARAVEEVRLSWAAYRHYLESFHEGEKDAFLMRERLFETMSPGLSTLVETKGDRPRRIWWSCASPEIEELPWELLVRPGIELALVRGTPGPARALVPRRGPRLQLVVAAASDKDVSRIGLDKLDGVDVEVAPRLRDAVELAVTSGAELLHVIGDGRTLASWDGVLEMGAAESLEMIGASELSSRLRGSRVVALGLSPSEAALAHKKTSVGLSQEPGDGPTAYRAFSHAATAIDTTNVLAQHGPWDHARTPIFRTAYEQLARTSSLEAALRHLRRSSPLASLSLFLRQRLGRELADASNLESLGPVSDPQEAQVQAELARRLVEQLRAVEKRYPKLREPLSASSEFREQEDHIKRLDVALDPWTKVPGGEP